MVDLADPRWKALGQAEEEDLGWGDADDEAEGEGQPTEADPDTPVPGSGPVPVVAHGATSHTGDDAVVHTAQQDLALLTHSVQRTDVVQPPAAAPHTEALAAMVATSGMEGFMEGRGPAASPSVAAPVISPNSGSTPCRGQTPPVAPASVAVAVAAAAHSTTPSDSGTSSWDDAGAPITEEERRRAKEHALAAPAAAPALPQPRMYVLKGKGKLF